MAIYGIGTDILRIERGQEMWKRFGMQAASRMLMPEELEELARAKDPGRFLARAFAAKEAFVKALGTGFTGVGWQGAGAVRAIGERPRLVFNVATQQLLDEAGIVRSHLSFSDEAGMIIAFVVLET
jgi:holo-[acyl-carrier protein] synthase